MKLNTLFQQKNFVFSFEIFPPKQSSDITVLYRTLEELKGLSPDYISITYGAGGTATDFRTAELAGVVKNCYGIEPLAHLTCAHASKTDILENIEKLRFNGVENVLALRGDLKEGAAKSTDFSYATDLVRFLKEHSAFNIVGACYPEGHTEAESLDTDIAHLKEKVDAGATHLNSQLFFDNEDFYAFRELARAKGISVPIQAGIMPIVKSTQIERTVKLSGSKLPKKFTRMVARYGDDPQSMEDAGVAYATEQIIDLISAGVDGVHLYIMNNARVARRIASAVAPIIARLG